MQQIEIVSSEAQSAQESADNAQQAADTAQQTATANGSEEGVFNVVNYNQIGNGGLENGDFRGIWQRVGKTVTVTGQFIITDGGYNGLCTSNLPFTELCGFTPIDVNHVSITASPLKAGSGSEAFGLTVQNVEQTKCKIRTGNGLHDGFHFHVVMRIA